MSRLLLSFTLLLAAPLSAATANGTARRDRTGVEWVFPFRQAKARARADSRLLFVKPLPFGSDAAGGWDPISEVMRAGPLSDERVIGLLNRRFVPLYFDLSERRAAGDEDARAFVVDARWNLGKQRVGAPPTLVMTVDGHVLKEIDNYATSEEVLQSLTHVLTAHPSFNKPTTREAKIRDYKQRARIAMDLQQHDLALKALRNRAAPAARLLRTKVLRRMGNWEAVAKELKRIRSKKLRDEVTVERAWLLLHRNDLVELRDSLKGFPATSKRYSEAKYLQGLAWYHSGLWERALETWEQAIRQGPEGPWIYRADWAYTQVKQGKKTSLNINDKRVSALNRIGYLARKGKTHPDLMPRLR